MPWQPLPALKPLRACRQPCLTWQRQARPC
nr:MAG TPA: hypothetical protein [Caudoviricetes sp.]